MLHIHTCCKRMFQIFRTSIVSVSSGCCICFAMVFKCFETFSQVFLTLVSSVSSIFFCMLQLFQLDIFKVDRVLPGIHVGGGWQRRRRSGGASDV
jgi:hypothetical protein